MENEEFFLKDIFEAAFLYTQLKTPPRIELDQSQRFCWFIFPDSAHCQKLIEDYWRNKTSIDAKTYADSFRSLKDLVFRSGIGRQGGRR